LVYDGDPAGIKAAMRGVDIILENDVNVHVVVLPEGEDPDSYAKSVSTEELIAYLENNKKDFIRFKAELLLEDNTDPLRTFELINEVLKSIAGIPNKIKQELYVREIAELTGTQERTLFTELNRIIRKKIVGRSKQLREAIPEPKMQVETVQKTTVNTRELLEREIIKLLLLFGNNKIKFKEYVIKDIVDDQFLVQTVETERTVAEKIMLELQADEIRFASKEFQFLYDLLMEDYKSKGELNPLEIVKKVPPEYTELVSGLLAETEKHKLSDWERIHIHVPDYSTNLHVWVTDVIYRLRMELLKDFIGDKENELKAIPQDDMEAVYRELEEVQRYNQLKKFFGDILNQVILT
jgi:DNA primase